MIMYLWLCIGCSSSLNWPYLSEVKEHHCSSTKEQNYTDIGLLNNRNWPKPQRSLSPLFPLPRGLKQHGSTCGPYLLCSVLALHNGGGGSNAEQIPEITQHQLSDGIFRTTHHSLRKRLLRQYNICVMQRLQSIKMQTFLINCHQLLLSPVSMLQIGEQPESVLVK